MHSFSRAIAHSSVRGVGTSELGGAPSVLDELGALKPHAKRSEPASDAAKARYRRFMSGS
jgi:hypothetical protein